MGISRRKRRLLKQDISRAKRSNSKLLALVGLILIIFPFVYETNQTMLVLSIIVGFFLILFGLKRRTDMTKVKTSLKKHKISKRQLRKL